MVLRLLFHASSGARLLRRPQPPSHAITSGAVPITRFTGPTNPRTFLTTSRLLSETTQPTVLSTLQPALKTALRAKDKPRLSVLRSLLAEITNASKTARPIDTDAALYSLLNKQIKAAQDAVEEFEKAKREDLVEKEKTQLNVLEELLGGIDKVEEEEIRKTVGEVVAEMQGDWKAGEVMGKVMGKFGGRPVDAKAVGRVVQESKA